MGNVQETREMTTKDTNELNSELETQVRALLDNLNAYIEQYHGGSVEMVSLEGDTLKVRLGGACLGCPLSPTTLHGWVAGTVHQFFPHLKVVQA
jgi:Fe-S cluster biogenesis protein NfuA